MGDGMRFFRAPNGVILTKGIPAGDLSQGIPPRYFLAVVDKEEPAFAELLATRRPRVVALIREF